MYEQPRRLEPRDHAAKLADATVLESRRRVLVAREVVVVELERDLSADAKIEITGGEPFRALVGLGDVGPDAPDRAGQQALELDGAGLDHGCAVVHLRFLSVRRFEAWAAAMIA